MKKTIFTILLLVLFSISNVFSQDNDHPGISFAFTDLIQFEDWIDDVVVDIRILRNLDRGLAIGGKFGTDFVGIFEAGASLRKNLVRTLYVYADGGYSFSDMEGGYMDVGAGTYFLKSRLLGIHLGYKHYFGPNKPYMSAGFSINF